MSWISGVERTWMEFMDGENLTIRGQKVAEEAAVCLLEGKYYRKDSFIWIPPANARYRLSRGTPSIQETPIRASYYTSVAGDDELIKQVRVGLWELGFDPHVFKKDKHAHKAKGVDIALTKDMLSHAFLGTMT